MLLLWLRLTLLLTAAVVSVKCLSSPPTTNKHKTAASKLLGVCGHLQNEALYSPAWADASTLHYVADGDDGDRSFGKRKDRSKKSKKKYTQKQKCLVSSRSVDKGEILSLLPVHGIGMKGSFLLLTDCDGKDGTVLTSNHQHHTLSLFDESLYHPNSPFTNMNDGELFLVTDGSRPFKPGWMGHLVQRREKSMDTSTDCANCMVIPMLGATPLCALVATKQINEGKELILLSLSSPSGVDTNQEEAMRDITRVFMDQYEREISELRSYLDMAYTPPETSSTITTVPQEETTANGHTAPEVSKERITGEKDDDYIYDDNNQDASDDIFRKINTSYPGLHILHENPNILAVDNFLTDDECSQIINMVTPHLVPCLIKDPNTGEVGPDPTRTSTNANIPRKNVPTIVSKIKHLLGNKNNDPVDEECLEIFQVLRYKSGQKFERHTDGFRGPVDACGHVQSGRLVTLFVYLNDVPEGGETRFTNIGLNIKPCRGTAIIHFPATLDLREDIRTEHEGSEAIDEKWIFVTWLWKHPRSDPLYTEENLPSLGDDVI